MTTITQAVQKTVVWGGFQVWQRNRDAFQRSWSVEIGGMAVEPFLFLLAIGYGLGKYVQPFDGVGGVHAVAAGRTRRFGHEAAPLVVANGFDTGTRGTGELPYGIGHVRARPFRLVHSMSVVRYRVNGWRWAGVVDQ